MAQIFSPPKKIEATMPSGRKTYRYAGDSDTLKKKIAGLKKSGASGVSVVAEETIQELSKSTLSNYIKKAGKQYDDGENALHKGYPEKPIYKMQDKRAKGMAMAGKKLAKKITTSEETIQELSSKTLKNYIKKAVSTNLNHHNSLHGLATTAANKLSNSWKQHERGLPSHDDGEREDQKAVIRGKGIKRAAKKLYSRTNEEKIQEIAQQSIITHNIKSKDSNRPVVKKGTQLEGAFKRQLIDKMEKERLGGGSKPNVEKKKISKAWSDIGYSNEKPKEKKKIHQSFQKGGKNDPGGMGAILHMEEGKKPGLWDNIHAKRARIKAGSKERMRTPGSKGAPTAQDFKDASESNVAFKNFLEARQINERKGGATAGFLMRQLYLKRLMKRLNLPVSVAAMIDK